MVTTLSDNLQIIVFKKFIAIWHNSSGGGRINEVTLCWSWLVLGWVTVFGQANHLGVYLASQANSAVYPQQDRKLVPAKVQ